MTRQNADNCLQNKNILVTGATDGIGKSAAIAFAQRGATVILLGRTQKKLEQVHDEILSLGALEPASVVMDFKKVGQREMQSLAEAIKDEFKQLDGLLLNAAMLGGLGPLEHINEGTWEEVLQVNLNSQFYLTQALLPCLKVAPCASVLFTSSSVGKKGRAYWGGYGVSKFAIEGLSQTFAAEYAESTIRFNCINPGATRTKMRAEAFPGEDPETLLTPEQLMAEYIFLMSDEAKEYQGSSLDLQPSKLKKS